MTKTTSLNWRLTDLPTAGEVADLVNSEVITKEEARDILFSEKDKSSVSNEQIQAYKEQIEFLQGLVTKLSQNNVGRIIGYNYTFTTPKQYWTTTWEDSVRLCGVVNNASIMSTTGTNELTCSL